MCYSVPTLQTTLQTDPPPLELALAKFGEQRGVRLPLSLGWEVQAPRPTHWGWRSCLRLRRNEGGVGGIAIRSLQDDCGKFTGKLWRSIPRVGGQTPSSPQKRRCLHCGSHWHFPPFPSILLWCVSIMAGQSVSKRRILSEPANKPDRLTGLFHCNLVD